MATENTIFFRHLRDNLPKGTNGMTAMALSTLDQRVADVEEAKAKATCPAHPTLCDLGIASAQVAAITLVEHKATQVAVSNLQVSVAAHGSVLEAIQRDVSAMAERSVPARELAKARGSADGDDADGRIKAWLGRVDLKRRTVEGLPALILTVVLALVIWGQVDRRSMRKELADTQASVTNTVADIQRVVNTVEEVYLR